jgi:hypothetical protein
MLDMIMSYVSKYEAPGVINLINDRGIVAVSKPRSVGPTILVSTVSKTLCGFDLRVLCT